MPRKKAKSDKLLLLHGPYKAPKLKVGDRETCLVRDRDVVVTSWTDAPVPWPKGVPVGGSGQPSIIVTGELARAVRCESAAAVMHHWGLSASKVVSRWRRALGVTRANCDGTRRLRQEVSERIAAKLRSVPLPEERRELMSRRAKADGRVRSLRRWKRPDAWAPEEVALLGTADDEAVARRLGRTRSAVRSMRCRLGVRPYRYRWGPRWV